MTTAAASLPPWAAVRTSASSVKEERTFESATSKKKRLCSGHDFAAAAFWAGMSAVPLPAKTARNERTRTKVARRPQADPDRGIAGPRMSSRSAPLAHRVEEVLVGLRLAQLVDEEFHRLDFVHLTEDLPKDPDAV